ncbi:extracellular ribonuclease LE isoform X1 [Sesamum indicum]|uniref:Extracellular ribonuclease LE isoform X1 n=1 Tax=Sesamum indicum TaxID=4182 RepID=A0A6I9SM35_SESIN|nr:extracellular ribonuclease LE isoform X1 [Sesamum indicum]
MGKSGCSFILLELLLLQCLISLGQGYDFFYFVQQWPGSYCDTKRSCCYPTAGKPAANFTIHGLWPNYNNATYPSNCNKNSPYDGTKVNDNQSTTLIKMDRTIVVVSDLFSRLEVSWATLACPTNNGTKFWSHEWEKHGTCSESVLDQHSYFEATLNIKDKVNLLHILEAAGIRPDDNFYKVEDIKEAIKAGTGYDAAVECNSDPSRNGQLFQVYLCVDASAKDLIECPVLPKRKCKSSIQFPIF